MVFFYFLNVNYFCIFLMYTKLNLPQAIKSTADRNLAKKAVKLAFDDLKEKNNGVLLSAHAVKIRSYAPDLAKTIAGLISTSNDSKFKEECTSLLGLNSHDAISLEENIKQKLFSVIDRNDREPQTRRMKESEHLLFNDDCFEEPDFLYEDYEDEESLSAFDM
ncbi:putative Type 2 DNA topoisomerase 6 subunit B-like protein [Helianthus anomalus]